MIDYEDITRDAARASTPWSAQDDLVDEPSAPAACPIMTRRRHAPPRVAHASHCVRTTDEASWHPAPEIFDRAGAFKTSSPAAHWLMPLDAKNTSLSFTEVFPKMEIYQ